MFALGCIQAQACHTGSCPTGITTQNRVRQKAIVVPDKAERVYRFHKLTLEALRELTQAAGLMHPNEFRATHIVRRVANGEVRLLANSLPQVGPGAVLAAAGGLHGFMAWERPVITDSGGFQVFSLAKLRTITDEGIHFSSHLDGNKLFLDVKDCFDIQDALGSDIAMVFDECLAFPATEAAAAESMRRSVRWASFHTRR